MKKRQFFLVSMFIVISMTQIGCASINRKLKSWLGGESQSVAAQPASTLTKFSESGDISPRVRRQYKRTTKETFVEQASVDAKAGSLWVNEGQGAYLFSQNVVRLIGDPLSIQVDGDPKDQLQSKVNVIKKLIAKIEERQKLRLRDPASADGSGDKDKADEKDSKAAKEKAAAQAKEQVPESTADLNVKTVPTRIVERTLEGNYRVKGSQPFMIGNREYKVIVTGIVRAEDFNDEGISAAKLLEPKFDIVSARRKESEF